MNRRRRFGPVAIGTAGIVLAAALTLILRLKINIPALMADAGRVEVTSDVVYKTVDGRQLRLDVYSPGRRVFTQAPAIIVLHGGGWDGGGKSIDTDDFDAFLDWGIAVVAVEYRLSDADTIFPAHLEDCADAVAYMTRHGGDYGIDPGRLCVLGTSAGGQLALLLALAGDQYVSGEYRDEPLSIRCAVSLCGPTDFLNLDGYTDSERAEAEALLAQYLGGTAVEKPDLYRQASPLYRLRRDAPPIFLAHGTLDRTVPFSQARRFYEAASACGMDITYVPVQNADHKFKAAQGETDPAMDELMAMLARFLLTHLIL